MDINDYTMENDEGELVVSKEDVETYAIQVALDSIEAYKQITSTTTGANTTTKEIHTMNKELNETVRAVLTETEISGNLVTGEILLDNIETLADKFIMSRLSWWQRLSISKTNKELAVTIATYTIVHALKTGGFGLTKYRINHAALDYVTMAANQRILRAIVKATGVDTNVAKMFLSAPTVTTVAGA